MRDTDRSAIVHGNRKSRLDANYAAFKTRNEAQTESDHVEEARPRPHLAYIWQIRRSDQRYLAYIWQTHVAKILKTYPRSGCFRTKGAIYKRDISGREAKSAIYNADRR